MPHYVDGYKLAFTARRSWLAQRTLDGKNLDIIPVTWTKDLYREGSHRLLKVWIKNSASQKEYLERRAPYVVAVAEAKDNSARTKSFSKFVALYEVVSTGKRLDDHGVEARITRRIGIAFDGAITNRKVTRIAYNSAGWRNPTGDARELEADGTYNRAYGFGHEDWLFRDEWIIAGWRYAFLQGVNKQWKKLVAAGLPIDVTLFTVQPDKRRRLVACIQHLECLSDEQADAAFEEYKCRGWLATMLSEIKGAGGDPRALGAQNWARHVLNVRFRRESVTMYAGNAFVTSPDPILGWHRYLLYDAPASDSTNVPFGKQRRGLEALPDPRSHFRTSSNRVEVSPEHVQMQKNLMTQLRAEFPPSARIVREENCVDVLVETGQDIYFYEIKSDLCPFKVLRLAIGQLLEYAFRRPDLADRNVHLIVVGRSPLTAEAEAYLMHLQERFSLPLGYRVVTL